MAFVFHARTFVACFRKISEGSIYHPSESESIGLHCLQFDVWLKCHILLAYARGMEVEIHASESLHQIQKLFSGIGTVHVDGHHFYALWDCRFQL